MLFRSRYDVFFERMGLGKYLNIDDDKLCVDLYAKKEQTDQKYRLGQPGLPYKIIHKYGLKLRPHESNVIFNIIGNDIFLYDMTKKWMKENVKGFYHRLLLFDYKNITIRKIIKMCVFVIMKKIKQ